MNLSSLHNNKGMALPLVIMVMVVLSILAVAFWGLTVSEAKQAAWQVNSTQAHYLAQSGVNSGLKILKQQFDDNTYKDMQTAITALNSFINARRASNPLEFGIADVGTYTIIYEEVDAITLKIRSVGTANNTNRTVTLTTDVTIPASSATNPKEWVSGINLTHSVLATQNFLTKGVSLEGKPIQTPQGGNNPSVFQASVILFTNYASLSLQQINQSVDCTFDSEVLYFQSGVELNNKIPADNKNDLFYSVTDAVVNNRPSTGRLVYGLPVGFEDAGRYSAFITGITSGVDYSSSYTTTYPFITGERYGVVYFGGNVNGGIVISSGYYFFPSGINGDTPISLKDVDILTKLIPIRSDDKIIIAIESMFKYTLGSNERLWDNK